MADYVEAARPLVELKPTKEFFVGIDSDGCAFDSMEIKHKECFIPNFIKHFGLAASAACGSGGGAPTARTTNTERNQVKWILGEEEYAPLLIAADQRVRQK